VGTIVVVGSGVWPSEVAAAPITAMDESANNKAGFMAFLPLGFPKIRGEKLQCSSLDCYVIMHVYYR
jgi:hypothetical protein